MRHLSRTLLAIAAGLVVISAQAAGGAETSTKDIVLDRVSASGYASAQASGAQPVGDAMAVSVLLESANGTLTPKSTQTLFRTGDRFRIKVQASRPGKISFYNTNPAGQTSKTPLWQGEVKPGQDTISARLALTGRSGIDKLHVVLEPKQEPTGARAWLLSWLSAGPQVAGKDGADAAKDIRLDVQTTPEATYLLNRTGQGIVTTVQIVHTPN